MAKRDPRQISGVEPALQDTPRQAALAAPVALAGHAPAPPNERARVALDLRTIFELELGYVMRTLGRLGVLPADQEDLAHDVFMAVHQKLTTYDPARPLRPWLFGFAFRVASHYRRNVGRETPLIDSESLIDGAEYPDVLLEKEARRRLVLSALDAVELSRRAVFVLHELDGVTCEEVARVLELPLGTVYSRLRLARQDFSAAVARLRARRVIE